MEISSKKEQIILMSLTNSIKNSLNDELKSGKYDLTEVTGAIAVAALVAAVCEVAMNLADNASVEDVEEDLHLRVHSMMGNMVRAN